MVAIGNAEARVTLRWATIAGFYTDWAAELVKEFEEKAGIEVQIVQMDLATMYEKEAIEMAGRTGAYDIITVESTWLAEWAHAGWLEPLDDYIARTPKEEFDINDVAPALVRISCTYKDKIYALPYYTFTAGMFYRKDLFDDPAERAAFKAKYGYDLEVPKTWEQHRDIASLPKKMKAVVAYKPGDYRFEEVDIPEIGDEEVLLRVGGCGVCAGDVKGYHGAPSFWGGGGQPSWIKAPFIPGHEFYGQVVALGKGAKEKYGLSFGDWAVSEQIIPYEKCRFCLEGKYWMCEVHNIYGFQGKVADGAYAEYVKLPRTARNYKLPEGFPLKVAPYVEPLACAIHAVERGDIQFNDVVVIAGLGPLVWGWFRRRG